MSPPRQRRSLLLVGLIWIYILVAVEWIMFIAGIKINDKLNDKYFWYKNAGKPVPYDVDYPPFPKQGIDSGNAGPILVLCLLPLAYDTCLLAVAFVWACYKQLNTVYVLCVSVLAFPMWTICGAFSIIIHLSARESRWDPAFNTVFGVFAAVQVILGVGWLAVMIAAAKAIDKAKKDKWVAAGVERGARRVEEYQLETVPPYQA